MSSLDNLTHANLKERFDVQDTWNTRRDYLNGALDSTDTTHSLRKISFDYSWAKGQHISNFHARRKSGELLPHTRWQQFYAYGAQIRGLYAIHNNAANSDVVVTSHWSPGWWYSEQKVLLPATGTVIDIPNWAIHPSQMISSVDIDLAQSLVQDAAAAIHSKGHDTLTFIAELSKLRKMFVTRAQKLLNNRSIEPNLKSKPGDWLESRYGWRTLIYDLKDLNEAIHEFDSDRKRFSERVGTTVSETETIPYENDTQSSVYTFTSEEVREVTTSIRGSVTADFQPSRFRLNPVATAWELLPYSFVIDWFISVGKAIEATSLVIVSKGNVASQGFHTEITQSIDATITPKSGYSASSKGSNAGILCEAGYSLTQRRPSTVSLNPLTRLRLDSLKIIDLLALIYQRLR